MAWTPIAAFVPQWVDSNGVPYSGAVLKAYQEGTSANTNLATDNTGGTTATDIVLNASGYPAVGGSIVVPHIDQVVKLALYATQAAADADTGAIWSIDSVGGDLALLGDTGTATYGDALVGVKRTEANAIATDQHEVNENRTIFAKIDFNVTGDGTTDDTTALSNAITAAAGKRLVISGTPLITSTITVSNHCEIIFEGAPGNFSGRYPDSYIKKDAAMTTTALIISGESVTLRNGGVVGVAGNTKDNIQITGHSCRWENLFSTLAGQDGLRIGEAATGTPNTNAFQLDKPCCTNNGRYGIHISDDDAGGAPNANAGTLIAPFVQSNTSHGLYINNAFGNTIIGILAQSNSGVGVYLDERSVSNTFIGGDIEANTDAGGTAGDDLVTVASVQAAGSQYGGNAFINTNVGTPPTDNATMTSRGWVGFDGFGTASGTGTINGEGTWTPTIAGSSTPGTNTYSTQNGRWFKNGRMVTAMFDCALSGNSVAMVGNLRISGLPFSALTGSLGAWAPSLIANLTYPASVTAIAGALNGTNLDLYGYGNNIAFAAIPVANIGASTGRLSGTITYITPATS